MDWIMRLLALYLIVLASCTASAPSMEDAYARAIDSECVAAGTVFDQGYYNPSSETWWFDIDADREGCAPACVVGRAVEINWRCTGLIEE